MRAVVFYLIAVSWAVFWVDCASCAEFERNRIDVESLANAIFQAEGGFKAVKPFGILSVPCDGYTECRQICLNTIRNNYSRWQKAGNPGDFISYLGSRYAPIGASNDPRGLNSNWVRNVKAIYNG